MKTNLLRLIAVVMLVSLLLSNFAPTSVARGQSTPAPETVTIPGTLQSKLGCPGDWQPECDKTFLTYDPVSDVWVGTFDLPAGSYEYKVALNKSWGENYGMGAKKDGPNISLQLDQPATVKFIYDHKSHYVTDSANSPIATVIGTFQDELGCPQDNDPTCLIGWMQDPEATGTYAFTTANIPAGDYEVRVALNESLDETYGAEGIKGEPALKFTAPLRAMVYFGFDAATHQLVVSNDGAPRGNLFKSQAHWITRDTILWAFPGGAADNRYLLHYDPTGALKLEAGKLVGGQTLDLTYTSGAVPTAIAGKYPHLSKYAMYSIKPEDAAKVPDILKGQVAISAVNAQGKILDATGVQIYGALDDLFTYNGSLGVTYAGDVPSISVWAPTARSVKMQLFTDSQPATRAQVLPMTADAATGVWSINGTPDWTNQFYLFEVEVYVPSQRRVSTHTVTDPYSISLSTNSTRSQIVNLMDPALMPEGWLELQKPALDAPEDIVLYELHVRDFSAFDQSVPEAERGTFKAFTHLDSDGMKHLKGLADAGLTHIHLLPAFDLASINEDKSQWKQPDPAALAALAPDSSEQQALLDKTRDADGYNWGYDPYHYNTPEGSYSTDPDGSTRILEFRQMVQSLSAVGLRVVMDVVYNHTNASGLSEKSVLDKVVPGYYHRLNNDGLVETSTCCQNTATEHNMMEKLMIDSALMWSTAYKVDGFRFDLMGHHMLSNMTTLRAALDDLTMVDAGVDGKAIYVYGEGWDFGEVAKNARGVNATQLNIAGSGIGVFNDRLRDAARGGGPFSGVQEQGFVTGLFSDPNAIDQGKLEDQQFKLFRYEDWIRVGLAGNLKDYSLVNFIGKTVTGAEIDYNGSPAGYTSDPQENIVYVSAHDNETLFDAIQYKAPLATSMADRARMQTVGLSLVLFSQGVPFIHAGDEILRSKSLDRNSYNSGDWFNRLDFTYQSNNFGMGLPPSGDNNARWIIAQPLLADPALKPAQTDILTSLERFKELLQIRKSSPLFRLRSADEVQARVTFSNTGPKQVPGVIVMNLNDAEGADLDPNYDLIVVVFNGSAADATVTQAELKGIQMALHPVQAQSQDSVVRSASFDSASGSFTVPARTTAVFVAAVGPAKIVATATSQPTATNAPTATTVIEATAEPTAASIPESGEGGVSTGVLVGIGAAGLAVIVALGALVRRRKR